MLAQEAKLLTLAAGPLGAPGAVAKFPFRRVAGRIGLRSEAPTARTD
jgi:hypothetical protein